MIKKIVKFFSYIIEVIQLGFYYICLVFSKGFFFYFFIIFLLLSKLFKFEFLEDLRDFFKKKQSDPVSFLVLVLLLFVGIFLYTYLYVDKNDEKHVDDSVLDDSRDKKDKKKEKTIASDKETYTDNEVNLYRKYGKMDINSVDFAELKKTNSHVVAWLMVDGTNVNYPIVQTNDNDYYLNHDIMKSPKGSGWPFMDFRNDINLSDSNTIFYGHNLLNKTAFGSLSNLFTNNWFKNSNHYIVVRTETKKYVYQVFACYYIDPETYYLQNNFHTENDYKEFLDKIKSRSNFNFNVDLSPSDKIITLSTCTDDNKGRKVIHAKLIEK